MREIDSLIWNNYHSAPSDKRKQLLMKGNSILRLFQGFHWMKLEKTQGKNNLIPAKKDKEFTVQGQFKRGI